MVASLANYLQYLYTTELVRTHTKFTQIEKSTLFVLVAFTHLNKQDAHCGQRKNSISNPLSMTFFIPQSSEIENSPTRLEARDTLEMSLMFSVLKLLRGLQFLIMKL